MSNSAKINIELHEDNSEVTLSGSYTNVINAICAGIKGLVINMSTHPKYKEIKEKSKMSDDEFEDEITYSVLLNILDRLDEHYVMSIQNNKTEGAESAVEETIEFPNTLESSLFNDFEDFIAELDRTDTNETET